MIGDRRLIAILGVSRGGTNHLAQRIHACEGVVGLSEGVSRLMHPTRFDEHQILTAAAMEGGVLKPHKPLNNAAALSVNKINYTLVAYPEAWATFLAGDANSDSIILLRNPFMVHASRVDYVEKRKPRRLRWREPAQLARELQELLAMAWRTPLSRIVFHERGLIDNYSGLLQEDLKLLRTNADRPQECPRCSGPLDSEPRRDDADRPWLHCAACDHFIEGEGNYNFLRREDDLADYHARERLAVGTELLEMFRTALGRNVVEFFTESAHWSADGAQTLRSMLDRDADRWRSIRLNEILYPY